MREIKFRAWDKIQNKMITSWRWAIHFDGTISASRRDEWSNDDFEIMQFTGLLDKNGKKIYEGDIIKTNVGNREVKWLSVGWSLLLKDNDTEIIGNIYENKNLLNN